MLEKPDLPDEEIIACLQREFGLHVVDIAFLPLGADRDTAVYRVVAGDKAPYFLKLRKGAFDEASVALPRFLSDQGIAPIIAPLATRAGQLWGNLAPYRVILYPFIEGRDGYRVDLTERQWIDLGAAVRGLHTAQLPPALRSRIRQEDYSPQWRDITKAFMERVREDAPEDPLSARLAAFLNAQRSRILDLVARTERLAQELEARPREFVPCHSDLHAGNVLIDGSGRLYIVDWDAPILAPKERDLMFPGGGQGFRGHTAEEEEALFYRGYGRAQVDPVALAYYRYERIVEDIASFCEQIFYTDAGEDREQSFRYLASNFAPNNTIEIAYRSDRALKDVPYNRLEPTAD